MKNIFIWVILLLLILFLTLPLRLTIFAEQSGSSPESGTDSRIKTAYDWLVAKGSNYGLTDATDWDTTTYAWGTYWNRIMEATAWEPDGTATAGDVPSGFTFYSGDNNRDIQTGTLFENQAFQDYDDDNCSANNGEGSGTCAAGDSEYTGEEGPWTLMASGGTAASVTDNGATVTLVNNTVYQDNWTQLYWSNRGSVAVDNEYAYVDGDDRVNPTGNSCNLNSPGTANAYCDTGDNDVSAAEFCLNLELDADNADNDNNGLTGTETDWRLPTQKELMQAYINGSSNILPNITAYYHTSTEAGQSGTWMVNPGRGVVNSSSKSNNTTFRVVCTRRD